jgi:hypothetical protein
LAPGLRNAVPDNQAEPIWNVWATFGPRGLPGDRLPAVRVYPVVSEATEAALELFIDRQMAELMVESWNPTSQIVPASCTSSRSSSRPQ